MGKETWIFSFLEGITMSHSLCNHVVYGTHSFVSIASLLTVMLASLSSFALLSALSVVHADLHQLIVGTFGTENLYTLEFDDAALTLNLVQNLSVPVASSWLGLSVNPPPSCLNNFNIPISMTKRTSMEQPTRPQHQDM